MLHVAVLHFFIDMIEKAKCLSNFDEQRVSDGVYMSLVCNLTLHEYVTARTAHCSVAHKQPCLTCSCATQVAEIVIKRDFVI